MSDRVTGELPPRRYPRFEVEIWVDFSTLDITMSTSVLNLSQGGVFIKSDRPLPLDTEVALVLRLPGGSPVHATGRVVWNHDLTKDTPHGLGGSGIQFLDIPDADRALLEDYLHILAAPHQEHRGH